MNGIRENMSSEHGNSSVISEGLLNALDALQPSEQRQKVALFSQAYPSIVRAIARQVPQKEILAALSRGGLKLHPVRYREMLGEEHERRGEDGEPIYCQSCGLTLHPMPVGHMPMLKSSAEINKQGDGVTMNQLQVPSKGEEA